MSRWIVLFALLFGACRECAHTCKSCVAQCAPFVVEACVPQVDYSVTCRCDPTRRAETP